MRQEDFLACHPEALAIFDKVRVILGRFGSFEVRTSRSQIALRRRRGFAYLWIPGQYLRKPTAAVVLSLALGRHDDSPRFKQVVHPAAGIWMHHLEIHDVNDIDDQVGAWLREAANHAA